MSRKRSPSMFEYRTTPGKHDTLYPAMDDMQLLYADEMRSGRDELPTHASYEFALNNIKCTRSRSVCEFGNRYEEAYDNREFHQSEELDEDDKRACEALLKFF